MLLVNVEVPEATVTPAVGVVAVNVKKPAAIGRGAGDIPVKSESDRVIVPPALAPVRTL